MRFDMVHLKTRYSTEPIQGAELIEHEGSDFRHGKLHIPPAESHQIRVRRMRSNAGAPAFPDKPDGLQHDRRIARMESARNVCRGYQRNDFIIVTYRIVAVALSEVCIQINCQ